MIYKLGTIESIVGLDITGISTSYFSVINVDDEIIVNDVKSSIASITSNTKLQTKTALTGNTGDFIYVEDKCIWLRWQIYRLEMYIQDYDLDLLGIDTVENGQDKLILNSDKTPLTELYKQKERYEKELEKCEYAKQNSENVWVVRRYETGTY